MARQRAFGLAVVSHKSVSPLVFIIPFPWFFCCLWAILFFPCYLCEGGKGETEDFNDTGQTRENTDLCFLVLFLGEWGDTN